MSTNTRVETLVAPIVAGIVVLLTLIVVIGVALRDPRPHDIPVAVFGPASAVDQLTQGFGANAPGAFKITPFGSEAEARSALDSRDAVAALILSPTGPRLVVAGAAGDALTSGVTAAFTNVFRAQGATLTVDTVRPFQPGDAHGILLFFLVFATLVSGLLAGALAGLRIGDRRQAVTAVVNFAAGAGILGPLAIAWLASGYGDRLWQVMSLCGLLALAIAAVTAGLARVAGAPGVALSALVLVLFGVISAGGPLGSELLPDAYRLIAPWLPAGPAYSALRGALFFDGVGVLGPVTLLSGYAVVGLALLGFARLSRAPERSLVPAGA